MSSSEAKQVGLPQEWIRKKRDGQVLSTEEIQAFVQGVTSGAVSEAQIAAFSMAVFFQDLNVDERVALTLAVRDSKGHSDGIETNCRVQSSTNTARAGWETPCRSCWPPCLQPVGFTCP